MKKAFRLSIVAFLALSLVFLSVDMKQSVNAATTSTATVTANPLNVRSEASTTSKVVGSLAKGTKIQVVTNTKNGWSQIIFKNKKAYVATQYLSFSKPATKPSTSMKATVTANPLNVRSAASPSGKIVGSLKKGTQVNVLAKMAGGWSQIIFNNKKAYVASQYLSFTTSTTPKMAVNKSVYTSGLEYPQISGLQTKSAQDKINSTMKNEVLIANKVLQKGLENQKHILNQYGYEPIYLYNTTYKVSYNKNNILSIEFYSYEMEGDSLPFTTVKTFNFNLKTGNLISLNNVVKANSKYSNIRNYVYKNLKNKAGYSVTKLSDVVVNNNTQYVYTDNGIKLLYQLYDIAPYATGIPQINVPASVYK